MVFSVSSLGLLDTPVAVTLTLCFLQYLAQTYGCSSIWLPSLLPYSQDSPVWCLSAVTHGLWHPTVPWTWIHTAFTVPYDLTPLQWLHSAPLTQTNTHTHTCMQSPSSRQTGRNGVEWEARTNCRHQAQGMAVYTEKCTALLAVYTKQPRYLLFSLFSLIFSFLVNPDASFLNLWNLPKNTIIFIQSPNAFPPNEPVWPAVTLPTHPLPHSVSNLRTVSPSGSQWWVPFQIAAVNAVLGH